jgi:hypothetical protein
MNFFCFLAVGLALALAGCVDCLGQGQNGVGPPGPDEFQLVFSNIVSRESELYLNGNKVCTVCAESEFVTVGNFPAEPETKLHIVSMVDGRICHFSPCCTSDCSNQTCSGEAVFDSTPFSGTIYHTGLIWRY